MTNRLAGETSPYLLQHAGNPVDWYPWGPEALERATKEDKPILLSIGYAACHWCHVMERESFENADTASLMNEWFVSVKVDREERPDLDAVYMGAVQAMTGHGGWPTTVFLTPDGKPFYGGTYFPPEDTRGMPGFKRLLAAVHNAWIAERANVEIQAGQLIDHIRRSVEPQAHEHDLTEMTVRTALDRMREQFDPEWGGFGGAPKFPQPMTIDFLLRMAALRQKDARDMATHTLKRMAYGGMYDQVGGGFARYSVDEKWHVPHFEKMLYDNGQLLRLYTRAWQLTTDPLFRRIAIETGDYLIREMRHELGGFFSSQDADSEGVEGKFFVWDAGEFAEIAGDHAAVAADYFDVQPGGNWPHEHTNVLWIPKEPWVVANKHGLEPRELDEIVAQVRNRLFEAREKRPRPGTDDKILASWNGLAISGLLETGRVFARDDFVEAGAGAARFVLERLRDADGRLMRSWRDGRASGPGFLDDHAMVAAAFLDAHETTFDESWFVEARRLVDEAIRLFADQEAAGFFDTGSDADALVIRPKDIVDNAVPAGNSVMAETLVRLAALTGEAAYEERAMRYLKLLQPAMAASPLGFGALLGALDLVLARPKEIAVAGDTAAPGTRAFAEVVWSRSGPNHVLAVGLPGRTNVPLLKDRPERDGAPVAYLCERFVCREPATTPAALARQLGI